MSGWEKRFVYPHDFASVPVGTVKVASMDYAFNTGQVAVKKDGYIHLVSQELIDDSSGVDFYALLRHPSWKQQEASAIRDASIRRRLSRLPGRLRKAVARRIDPHYDDEWD